MKKILALLFLIIFCTQTCIADEETIDDINSYFIEQEAQPTEINGYVEYNQQQEEEEKDAVLLDSSNATGIKITQPKSFNSKSLISKSKVPSFGPIQDQLEAASKFSSQEYAIRPVSSTLTKKYGNFSLGTAYNSFLDSAQVNYSTSIFTRYEGKYFALTSGFSKSTNSNYDSYNNKFFVAPELKLTKRLSLLDVMQTDMEQISKKNEIVLRYTPHLKKYADEVQFELGAGQSYYDENYLNSSVRFSTRFKL